MKSTINSKLEQEKFNKILGFTRWAARDAKNWLISTSSNSIGFYPFEIHKQENLWILKKHQQVLAEFSSPAAALAYCAYYKKQQYYLAQRTAELDQKIAQLAAELETRSERIRTARQRSQHWKLDLQLARYSETASEYKKLSREMQKTLRDSKLFWQTNAKYNKI